jgi:subtilisin family serine protease
MKKTLIITITMLLVLSSCGFFLSPAGPTNISEAPVKDTVESTGPMSANLIANGFNPTSEADLIEETVYGYVILKTDMTFSSSRIAELGAEIVDSFSLSGSNYFYIYKSDGILNLLGKLQSLPGVYYAEADIKHELFDVVSYDSQLDDPYVGAAQYSYFITELGRSLETYGLGTNEVYIATVDSGINIPHEEFQGVFEFGYSMFTKTGTTGAVEYAFVGDATDPVPMDGTNWDGNPGEGHGTHVSGTIAALGNNSAGVVGVAPDNVRYILYKCFADDASGSSVGGSGSSWAVYGSLKHLVDWKIANSVSQTIPVNMSLGGSYANSFASEMIDYGLENNVVVVAASGNDGQNTHQFPAGYAGVITVGATNGRDELVHFSNRGQHISVTAPGYDIVSVGNTDTTEIVSMSGTSMATPFVTGLIANMLTFDPTLTPAEIKYLLESSADDLGDPGFDESFGWGRVNVFNAIAAVQDHLAGAEIMTPYSDYSLVIEVTNLGTALEGVAVYLYKEDGTFMASVYSDENGLASFNLIPKGIYTAKAMFQGALLADGSDAIKTVDYSDPAADVVVAMAYNQNIYYIETLENDGNGIYNSYGTAVADTVIEVFDSSQNLLLIYDYNILDTVSISLEPGETYYIRISPYSTQSDIYAGNYSLNVSKTLAGTTTGTALMYETNDVDNPGLADELEFSDPSTYVPNDDFASALPIVVDTVYHNFLSDGLTYDSDDPDVRAPVATATDLSDVFVITIP